MSIQKLSDLTINDHSIPSGPAQQIIEYLHLDDLIRLAQVNKTIRKFVLGYIKEIICMGSIPEFKKSLTSFVEHFPEKEQNAIQGKLLTEIESKRHQCGQCQAVFINAVLRALKGDADFQKDLKTNDLTELSEPENVTDRDFSTEFGIIKKHAKKITSLEIPIRRRFFGTIDSKKVQYKISFYLSPFIENLTNLKQLHIILDIEARVFDPKRVLGRVFLCPEIHRLKLEKIKFTEIVLGNAEWVKGIRKYIPTLTHFLQLNGFDFSMNKPLKEYQEAHPEIEVKDAYEIVAYKNLLPPREIDKLVKMMNGRNKMTPLASRISPLYGTFLHTTRSLAAPISVPYSDDPCLD